MRAVVLVDDSTAARAVPLVRWLERVDGLVVTQTADPRGILGLAPNDVLVALVDEQPLDFRQEQALAAHVGAGGGIVLLGATLHAWRDATSLSNLVGKSGDRQRRTELVVDIALRRIPSPFAVDDHAWIGCAVPPGAETWLRATWRFRDHALGWACGRAVVVTLGGTAETCADPAFARIVLRAVRSAAGRADEGTIRVGMLGWGAIGAEHAAAIDRVDGLELAAVCDRDPARLAQAGEHADPRHLLDDAAGLASADDVDLVIISVPPHHHAAAAIGMLRAGKHVVVEKPFALTVAQADAVIAEAEAAGRDVTVYQNRRWDPDFREVREVVSSGALGEVFHVETFVGGFGHPCRYWHSDEVISGGVIYDWGSHYLDWLLQIVDAPVERVSGARHKRVWHDVTNADMARVTLRFADGREAEFVHSDVAAAPKPKWYVLGTAGALTADWREAQPFEQTAVRVHHPGGDVETLALGPALDAPFHRNLADRLLCGEPLVVTAGQARRTTAVLEAASISAEEGGHPVHLGV